MCRVGPSLLRVPPRHGTLTARRRAREVHGSTCKPTERVLPPVPLGYWRARLLRHGRGAARAVLSCAGAYVSGAAGSNACPVGSARIEAEAACLTAAAAAGKTIPGSSFFVETYGSSPRGCYYSTSTNLAYFNTHAVGAGWSSAQLLCAALAATTGAPLKRRRRTDARSARTGARACRHRACAARPARGSVRSAQPACRCAHLYKCVYIHTFMIHV